MLTGTIVVALVEAIIFKMPQLAGLTVNGSSVYARYALEPLGITSKLWVLSAV